MVKPPILAHFQTMPFFGRWGTSFTHKLMTEWKAAEVTNAAMARAFEAFPLESVGYPLVISQFAI